MTIIDEQSLPLFGQDRRACEPGAERELPTVQLSVIIPHLNQSAMLGRCLASLATGQSKPHEIIVVDNGSAVLPQEVCDAWPGVRLMQEMQPGPGPARNRGVQAATGNVLAFIDADCVADPLWLAEARRAMADPQAKILGGDVRIAYANPAHLSMLEAYESIYAYRMDRYIAREGFTGTGNLVVRRSVLLDVGPFAGIGVAEDRDWGQRATAKGYRIRYVAKMKVYHPARQRLSELCQKWDRHMAHDFDLARQSKMGRAKWTIKMLAIAASPLAEVPKIVVSNRVAGMRARVLALMGLAIIRTYRAGMMARLLVKRDPENLTGRWNRPAA